MKAEQLPLQLTRSHVCLHSSAASSTRARIQALGGGTSLILFPCPLPVRCALPAQLQRGSDPVHTHTPTHRCLMERIYLVLHHDVFTRGCPNSLLSACLPQPFPCPPPGASPVPTVSVAGPCPCSASLELCHFLAPTMPQPPFLGTAQFLISAEPVPAHRQIYSPDATPNPVQHPTCFLQPLLLHSEPSSSTTANGSRCALSAGCPRVGKKPWHLPVPPPKPDPSALSEHRSSGGMAASGGAPLAANKAHPVLLDLWLHLLDPTKGSAKGSCAGRRLTL